MGNRVIFRFVKLPTPGLRGISFLGLPHVHTGLFVWRILQTALEIITTVLPFGVESLPDADFINAIP